MKSKTSAFFKELLFCGITVGIGFHLHYQIVGDKKEPAEHTTVANSQSQISDTTAIVFDRQAYIKSNFEKTK